MGNVRRPALEGTVAVRGDRRLSFAEYGPRRGPAIIWMHGTPGARRQIPLEAREYADRAGRSDHRPRPPGDRVVDRAPVPRHPGLDPRPRAGARHARGRHRPGDRPVRRRPVRAGGRRCAARPGARRRRPRRRRTDPRRRRDVDGGAIQLAVRLAPLLSATRVPLGIALTQTIRLVRPLAGPALDLYAAVQPEGDKALLARPEFKAMFLDDLLNGSRFQSSAALNDLVLFTRHWGFEAADVQCAGALVARRRRPHRAVPPRRARRRPAAGRDDVGHRRREPPRRARHRRRT